MRTIPALPAVALALGLGCLRPSPSPPVVYYTLASMPAGAAAADGAAPAVEVLPVRLPEVLQRPQMLVPEGPSGLALLEASRWGNPLDRDLQRVLVRNLSVLLGSGAVVAAPDGERVGANYQVRVEVQRWDARGGQGLVLEAAWMITRVGGGPALAWRRTTLTEPLPGPGPGALVAAHSRLAERLSRDIAKELEAVARAGSN
jgi:uncharacterized lipoprotein YmbA